MIGVWGRFFFRSLSLFHGSSLRKRIHVSNVAPPQASSDAYPTLSSFSVMGSISSVSILVASRDWWASLSTRSVILTIQILPNIYCLPYISFNGIRTSVQFLLMSMLILSDSCTDNCQNLRICRLQSLGP